MSTTPSRTLLIALSLGVISSGAVALLVSVAAGTLRATWPQSPAAAHVTQRASDRGAHSLHHDAATPTAQNTLGSAQPPTPASTAQEEPYDPTRAAIEADPDLADLMNDSDPAVRSAMADFFEAGDEPPTRR